MQVFHWVPGDTAIEIYSHTPEDFKPEYGQLLPSITPYLLNDGSKKGCIIVCPGGAYEFKATHEADPIAQWLNSVGINAFVLNYRVAPYHHPSPLCDALQAIRFVRAHHERFGIDPKHVGILGFSAGGHLSASAATLFTEGDAQSEDPVLRESSRPDVAVLCYPVTAIGTPFAHEGSGINLLGEGYSKEQGESLCAYNNVTENTPPVFIWHTAQDSAVPFRNTLEMTAALGSKHVDVECHIYPHGEHGLGLAQGMDAGRWCAQCAAFLKRRGFC